MIKRYVVKSCCGKQAYIFQTDKPVNESHLSLFSGEGYISPENFKKHGVFFVRGHGITAQCSMGTNRVSVRCSGDCSANLDKFAEILEKAING